MGLVPKIPSFLDKQAHSFIDYANETHLLIYIRFVVEAVNGQRKKWRALSNIIPNVQIPYIGDYVKIVSAILNAFHPARRNNIEDDNAGFSEDA
ncbi:DDE Tnp4 domain-containing protein [Trichonephila clavipes]|nr:DDE Tnp4 domain-containing protein [Trichonephila clavipes]